MNKKKCAIIGSGIAALSAAVRLQHKGFEVHVYEKNEFIGGKLSEFKLGDYRFDAGPSVFTMPNYLEEIFLEVNKNINDYFTYSKPAVACHYFWSDGSQFNSPNDTDKFIENASTFFNEPQKNITNFLKKSKEKFELTEPIFINQTIHQFKNYFSLKILKGIFQMHKLESHHTMHESIEKTFSNPKIRQLFERYATYNGSNPYKAPATLNLIPHVEINKGIYCPDGGMYSISKALYHLGLDLGVKYFTNQEVQEIVVKNNTITAIKVDNKLLPYDKVISNMDIWYTYKQLLPQLPAPSKILSQEKSSSVLVFYWGIKKEFPQLGIHNIIWGEDYKEEFDATFEKDQLPNDPTIYINITSKYSPSDAPKGSETWFVLVNAPLNKGQNWEKKVNQIKNKVIQRINKTLDIDIQSLIEEEKVLTPEIIAQKYATYQGSVYGNSSNNKFAAFLRHANFHTKIKGLYFLGGTVHPGAGVPMCIKSGKIVSDIIEN